MEIRKVKIERSGSTFEMTAKPLPESLREKNCPGDAGAIRARARGRMTK
jgi:hypothetical protein